MNTLRRPRRRPRVESVNFRTLWWVLAREAAWRVIEPDLHVHIDRLPYRSWLRDISTDEIRRHVARVLRDAPSRRFTR